MGMVHGDGNTRQCMATAVAAYKQSFGFDAPPYTYADFEESDVIVLVGSNLCIAHPIMWERVCRNPHQPAIVVIDPRKTETAMAATTTCALRPKSDLALLYGAGAPADRARAGSTSDFIDAHTSGFDGVRGARGGLHARSAVGARDGPARRAHRASWRALIARGQARLVLVDHGRQPEPRGRRARRRRSSTSR